MTLIVPQMAYYDAFTFELQHIGPEGVMLLGCSAVPLPDDFNDATFTWDSATRTMVQDPEKVRSLAIAEIKAEAERQILEIAPLWRQVNAVRKPSERGSAALFEAIDAIREWSNDEEAKLG